MTSKIPASISQLIGGTPLMETARLEKEPGINARILVKLEYLNPAGSVKDRVARSIIDAAEKSGAISPGGTFIEPTSGNTGIGLAALCAAKGYNFIAVMPDSMSLERRRLIEAYGARIVLTPGSEGMAGAIARAEELTKTIPGSVLAGQFTNPANPEAHREGTGPEIYEATDGKIDIFIAGVGTGGTITGVGEYLKRRNPDIKILAVEPDASPVLSGGKAGSHKIQGIGAGFVPEILNTSIYDAIIRATSEDSMAAARLLAKKEGLLVGISSGAALWAAMEEAKKPENRGKTIVALLPDGGDRYYSTELFENR